MIAIAWMIFAAIFGLAPINWEEPVQISEAYISTRLDASMNDNNEAVVIWQRNDTENLEASVRLSDNTWDVSKLLGTNVLLFSKVFINNKGNAVVVWGKDAGGGLRQLFSSYYTRGTGWVTTPSLIATFAPGDDLGEFSVFLNDQDQALVAYMHTQGGNQMIESVYSNDAGASWMGTAQQLVNVGVGPEELNNLKICLNSENQAIVAWSHFNNTLPVNTIEIVTAVNQVWNLSPIILHTVTGTTLGIDFNDIKLNNQGQAIAVWQNVDSSTPDVVQTLMAKQSGSDFRTWNISAKTLLTTINNNQTIFFALNNSNQAKILNQIDDTDPDTSNTSIFSWTLEDGWGSQEIIFPGNPEHVCGNLVMNDKGDALLGYLTLPGASQPSQPTGQTGPRIWFVPHQLDICLAGLPVLAINNNGETLAAWIDTPDEVDYFLKASSGRLASIISGKRVVVKALLQRVYANDLSWPAVDGADSYHVFGDSSQTKLLYSGTEPRFIDKNIEVNQSQTYFVYSVSNGIISSIGQVTVSP